VVSVDNLKRGKILATADSQSTNPSLSSPITIPIELSLKATLKIRLPDDIPVYERLKLALVSLYCHYTC